MSSTFGGDERLAIFDRSGRRIGTKSRVEVHRDGDIHALVFLWAARVDARSHKRFLLQLRGRDGDPYRGQLDALAGGHVSAEEGQIDAVRRECREETGVELAVESLLPLGERFLENPVGVCRRVFECAYLSLKPIHLEDVTFSSEANGFVEVELDELAALLDGQRDGIDGLARTPQTGSAIQSIPITRGYFSAYAEPILEIFRLSIAAIARYLDTGSLGKGIEEGVER